MKTDAEVTKRSPKVYLVDLPVAKVSFFQVIPGVKVPVREDLGYGARLRWHGEAFNCFFRQVCLNPLYSSWVLPLMFNPADGPSGCDTTWEADEEIPEQIGFDFDAHGL